MTITTSFRVQGMTCGGCEQSVTRIIRQASGVLDVAVDRSQQKAQVTWADSTNAQAIAQTSKTICASVSAAGFDCSVGQ